MAEAVSIFNVISVFSAVVGFVGFMQSNLPAKKTNPVDSSVRIAVALNGDKGVPGALRHAAGQAPLINAFNENQHFCRTCTWIDIDHSHGITTAAMQIRMQDFTNITGDYSTDPAFYCRHPTMLFRADQWFWTFMPNHPVGEISFWDASDPSASTNHPENDGVGPKNYKKPKARRHSALDQPPFPLRRRTSGSATFSHLIASPHERHSARELCEHDMSHGPDFVSFSEGVFCDMDRKRWWPLCNGTVASAAVGDAGKKGCYHWDTHSLVVGGGQRARNYSHVEEWE